MGCAAARVGAGAGAGAQRGVHLGSAGAAAAAAVGRAGAGGGGCKVAPEPKELEEGTAALPPMPGSPSFRYYCQKKTAAVDKIVFDADNSDGSVRIKEVEDTNLGGCSQILLSVADETL